MEMSRVQKDFDCLKMKSELQERVYAEVKDMTAEERIAYFNAAPHLCSGYRNIKQTGDSKKINSLVLTFD
jgi:GTP cyclohydrolase I